MAEIIVIGGGFSGVWSAAGAARVRSVSGEAGSDLSITLVSGGDDLVIRPRLYEADPHSMRVPLDRVLDPIGVERVNATVTDIDTRAGHVRAVLSDGRTTTMTYDRLVLASGS